MLDMGVSSKEASHSPAHHVCQYRYDDRHTDDCSRLRSQDYVHDVAQHIDDEQSQRHLVSPTSATPQACCCQSTTHTDGAHQNNCPRADTCEGFTRTRVELPHGLQKTSGKEERDENCEANDSAEEEENAESRDAEGTRLRFGC